MCNQEYFDQQHLRVEKLFVKSKHKGFANKRELANWYASELKKEECRCHFCGTSIFDINRLIDAGSLKTRAVRGNGKRGPVLEIDKNDEIYTKDLCVLACYYCNNDKSYTISAEDYKKYFGPARLNYHNELLAQLDKI